MNFLRRLALHEKKTWWQLASRCRWNRTRPWHASELVSFLVGLRTYQHPGICEEIQQVMQHVFNPLTPNDLYMSRTALLTSKRCIS